MWIQTKLHFHKNNIYFAHSILGILRFIKPKLNIQKYFKILHLRLNKSSFYSITILNIYFLVNLSIFKYTRSSIAILF